MRILITTDSIGGVWTFTKELSSNLLRLGYEVLLVSFGRSPSPSQESWCESAACAYEGMFQYEFSLCALEWMENNGESYECGRTVLLGKAIDFDPDILLSSQFCFGALPLNIPKIVIAHSDVLSWAKACSTDPLESTEWLDTYCSVVAKGILGATAIVAPTAWMLSELAANFCLPVNAWVIPNGRTVEEPSAMAERKLQAVIAGRLWDEAKNAAIVWNISSPMPIILAGEIDSQGFCLRGQSDGLILIGPQDEEDLLHIFRESAIYLCTSIYEPFGLAPLEAALCGCAVVAYDIPSLREVWEDSALYFRDAASLSALLTSLHDQPKVLARAQLLSQSRGRSFSSSAMTAKYIELFDSIARQPEKADATQV